MLVSSSKAHISFYNTGAHFLSVVCLRLGLNTHDLKVGEVDSLSCRSQGLGLGCETIEVPLPAEPITDPGCAF